MKNNKIIPIFNYFSIGIINKYTRQKNTKIFLFPLNTVKFFKIQTTTKKEQEK